MKNFSKIVFFIFYFHSLNIFMQTDSQIKQAKSIIKKKGLSESQVKNIAKSKGFSESQINDGLMKLGIGETSITPLNNQSQFKGDDILNNSSDAIENDVTINESLDIEINDESLSLAQAQEKQQRIKFFGYDIFKQDPSNFQDSSPGAIDPNYLIGAGDEIILMLWGETQFRQVLTVDREGFIFVPEIGQVFVNGLNLDLLESKLFKVLSQYYSSLNPLRGEATTFLDISLGKLRPLRVQVLGEVSQPGIYTLNPTATIFSSLYYFNGPTTNGSLREIQLIRDNEVIAKIDFYDYLFTGKKPDDEKLQTDDIIFIPQRKKTVTISGEIGNPAIYELIEGEKLEDLIKIAKDLKNTAYLNRAQIDRIIPFEDRDNYLNDRIIIDIDLRKSKTFELLDGDQIKIFSILEEPINKVEIVGSIARPGVYELSDSLTIKELIENADSLLGDAYMERIDIIRTKPDLTLQLIKLNLKKVMEANEENNIILNDLDKVRVFSMNEMIPNKTVEIKGYVKKPGKYILVDNMTAKDLVFMAGGFVDDDFKKGAYLDRADIFRFDDDKLNREIISFNLGKLLKIETTDQNLTLEPGDEIIIYSKKLFDHSKPVTIEGSIKRPGTYDYKEGMSLLDLILESGGIEQNIYIYKVEIARLDPNSQSEKRLATSLIFDYSHKGSINDDQRAILLKPYDYVSVRPDPYFTLQKKVTVSGAVNYPGEYAILNAEEKISDLLSRSGGVKANAFIMGSSFFRKGNLVNLSLENIISKPNSKYDFTLQDGDKIEIPEMPNTIQILGEVNVAGFYKFQKGQRVSELLRNAGGLTREADKNQIFLTYPDGKSKKYTSWLGNPKVIDGSIITVERKPEEKPFDKNQYASDLTTIIANIAQVLSIIFFASNN